MAEDRWTETAREYRLEKLKLPLRCMDGTHSLDCGCEEDARLASLLRDSVATAERERDEARDIVTDLRRKLALAGVEGSPPLWGQGTIPDLMQQLHREREVRRGLTKAVAPAIGDLAERLALDMDHDNKDHSRWYRAVKKARAALAAAAKLDGEPKA